MAEKIITVTVGKDGNMTVEGAGFKGNGCTAAMKAFEAAGKVKQTNYKPEFYEGGPANNTVSAGK